MQDPALASLRPRSSRPRPVLLALAVAATGFACTQKGPLSDEEMEQLRAFMLPAGPPDDPSNAFADNPAAIALGKKLYFETRYAGALLAPYNATDANGNPANGALGSAGQTGMVGCASCHDPATGGADSRSRPNETSLGASYTLRNAPTVINAAYSPAWQFWDGRADSLWSQALQPPEGTAECAGSRLKVVHVLYDNYKTEFTGSVRRGIAPRQRGEPAGQRDAGEEQARDVHAGRSDRALQRRLRLPPTDDDRRLVNRAYANFGKAIAAYERQLVSNNFDPSPFDRFMAGDEEAMAPAAIRGARLFIGHAGCAECHRGPMFTDYAFHNIGVPQAGQYVPATDTGRFDGIGKLTTTDSERRQVRPVERVQRPPGHHVPPHAGSDGSRLGDGAVQDADVAERQQDRPLHARRRLQDAVGRREPLQLRRRDRQLFGRAGSGHRAVDADQRGARRSGRVPGGAGGRRPQSVGRSRRCSTAP